jgi:hypothetical protein
MHRRIDRRHGVAGRDGVAGCAGRERLLVIALSDARGEKVAGDIAPPLVPRTAAL